MAFGGPSGGGRGDQGGYGGGNEGNNRQRIKDREAKQRREQEARIKRLENQIKKMNSKPKPAAAPEPDPVRDTSSSGPNVSQSDPGRGPRDPVAPVTPASLIGAVARGGRQAAAAGGAPNASRSLIGGRRKRDEENVRFYR